MVSASLSAALFMFCLVRRAADLDDTDGRAPALPPSPAFACPVEGAAAAAVLFPVAVAAVVAVVVVVIVVEVVIVLAMRSVMATATFLLALLRGRR